jgi:hypothetical protein
MAKVETRGGTPGQNVDKRCINSALFMLRIARTNGIKLTPYDISVNLGYERSLTNTRRSPKDAIPFAVGRRKRFKDTIEAIHEKALHENTQYDALKENKDSQREFEDPFWRQYGYTSDSEVQQYLRTAFKHIPVDFSNGHVPIEFKWLEEAYSDDYRYLSEISQQGYAVQLTTCRKLPEEIERAIRQIAEGSQKKFVSTWLPGFIRNEKKPVVIEKDCRDIRKNGDNKFEKARKVKEKTIFRGTLLEEKAKEDLEVSLDFNRSIAQIADFIPLITTTEIVAGEGQEITPEIRQRLQSINQHLFDGLGREYSLRKIRQDDTNKVSENGLKILASLAILSPLVQYLKFMYHLPKAADPLAAAGDDIVAEASELKLLSDAGVKIKELIKDRGRLIGPLIPIAIYASTQIESVRVAYGDRLAGMLFMASALIVSAATSAVSGGFFSEAYGELAAEGKLPEYYPKLSKERQEQMKGVQEPEDMWQIMESQMKELEFAQEEIADRCELFNENPQKQNYDALTNQPSKGKRTMHGVKESMVLNPVRAGVAFVSFLGPLIGYALGPQILQNGFTEVAGGGSETYVGFGGSIAGRALARPMWNLYVRRRIREIKEGKKQNPQG